jgi:hypothetical protein
MVFISRFVYQLSINWRSDLTWKYILILTMLLIHGKTYIQFENLRNVCILTSHKLKFDAENFHRSIVFFFSLSYAV